MAGNDLTINVVAETAQAQKGIDNLEKSLKELGEAGKGVEQTSQAMDSLGKSAETASKALPGPEAAKGMEAVGKATESAGTAATAAGTKFGELGGVVQKVGQTIKDSLVKLGGEIGGVFGPGGKAAGEALTAGLLEGVAGLDAALTGVFLGAIAAAVGGSIYLVRNAGKDYAEQFTKAFNAGMTVDQFVGFKALADVLGVTGKEVDKFAQAFGKLQDAFREGKVPDNVVTTLEKMGVSLKNLSSTDINTSSAELLKLFNVLRQMPTSFQADFLKDLFKGADAATIAAMGRAIADYSGTVDDLANKLPQAVAQQQALADINERSSKSYDALLDSLGRLAQSLTGTTSTASAWNTVMEAAIAIVDSLSKTITTTANEAAAIGNVLNATNELAQALGSMDMSRITAALTAFDEATGGAVTAMQNLAKSIVDGLNQALGPAQAAAQAMVQGMIQTFTTGAQQAGQVFATLGQTIAGYLTAAVGIVGSAAKAVADAVVAAFTAMGAGIKSAFDSAIAYITDKLNALKSLVQSLGAAISSVAGGAKQDHSLPQMMPQQFVPSPNSFRRLQAVNTNTPMGLVGISPLAAVTPPGRPGTLSPQSIQALTDAFYENARAADANTAAKARNTVANQANTASTTASAQSQTLSTAELQKYAQTLNTALNPQIAYNAEIAKYEQALRAGLITSDAFALAQKRAQAAMASAASQAGQASSPMQDLAKNMQSFGETMASSLADAIVNGEDLGEVFKNLAKQLASMLIQTLLLKPLMNSIMGGLGGIMGFSALPMSAMPMAAANSPMLRAGVSPTSTAGLVGPKSGVILAGQPTQKVTNNLGSIKMNISPTEAAATGDSKKAQAFGDQVVKLIQQQLIQESRPGGLLTSRGRAA